MASRPITTAIILYFTALFVLFGLSGCIKLKDCPELGCYQPPVHMGEGRGPSAPAAEAPSAPSATAEAPAPSAPSEGKGHEGKGHHGGHHGHDGKGHHGKGGDDGDHDD